MLVIALSIPPAKGDVPLTNPKSPSVLEVIAFPFGTVPLSAAVIVTVQTAEIDFDFTIIEL